LGIESSLLTVLRAAEPGLKIVLWLCCGSAFRQDNRRSFGLNRIFPSPGGEALQS
jgi:hypothetical protein